MQTDYTPDVPYLCDELAILARLNYRHFVENPEMALEVARAMTDGRIRWTRESVDKWVDVSSMVKNDNWHVDCEEIAAITAAFFLCCFGTAKVGIRQITPEGLCHCIASVGNDVYDCCTELGMVGSSTGPAEWRDLKEKPMSHVFVTSLKTILSPLWKKSRETPSTAGTAVAENGEDELIDLETGASWANILGSLVPPVMIDKVENLERDRNKWKREASDAKNKLAACQKELAIVKKQKDEQFQQMAAQANQVRKDNVVQRQSFDRALADMTSQRDAALSGKNTCEATLRTKEQMLTAANAYLAACRGEVTKIEKRSPAAAPEITKVFGDFSAQYDDDQLADIIADKWANDNDALASDMMTLGTLSEHAKSLACCSACAHDKPCDAKVCTGPNCPVTGDSHHDYDDSPESSERDPVAPFFGTGSCLPCQR